MIYVTTTAILFLKKIKQKGISCTGKILSFESGSRGYRTPIVEFTPIGGELIAGKPFFYASTDLSKIRSYSKMIDKEILILYDPDDPKKFILKREEGFNYVFLALVIVIGLLFLILSICSFIGYIKIGE